MCGVVTRKYKEKDQDDDLAKAFQYFDEDGMGKISLKNLRKVTRELGENITDEQLEAMIDECRPLKLLEYCPLFYQYYCYTRPNQGSVLGQIQVQITVWREKNLLMTDN
jgi:hypothetical protein